MPRKNSILSQIAAIWRPKAEAAPAPRTNPRFAEQRKNGLKSGRKKNRGHFLCSWTPIVRDSGSLFQCVILPKGAHFVGFGDLRHVFAALAAVRIFDTPAAVLSQQLAATPTGFRVACTLDACRRFGVAEARLAGIPRPRDAAGNFVESDWPGDCGADRIPT